MLARTRRNGCLVNEEPVNGIERIPVQLLKAAPSTLDRVSTLAVVGPGSVVIVGNGAL